MKRTSKKTELNTKTAAEHHSRKPDWKKILILLSVLLVILIVVLGCVGIANSNKKANEEITETIALTNTGATADTTVTETTVSDITAPVIKGVTDRVVHIGETVAYKQGVTVTDDTDPSPKLEVNADSVDISTVGEYTVIYTASDAAGNTATAAAKVKVVPQESISTEQANALADEVISRIITDDMTDSEKLDAVWWYIHELGYVDVDYGEPEEYLDNAYYFIKRMMGNCRCVYGASRLLLERLGWKCMMICNKEDAAQTHYWNLVSLDDGETWYHFDPVCWGWEEEYVICMVSDEWILAYSDWHNMETYDWDTDQYPATPEENWDPDGFFGDRLLFDDTGFYEYYYGDSDIGGYQGYDYPGYVYAYAEDFYDEDDTDYYFYDQEYWDDYYAEDYDEEYYEDEEYSENGESSEDTGEAYLVDETMDETETSVSGPEESSESTVEVSQESSVDADTEVSAE